MAKENLRTGYTTGSSAAAASKAALLSMISQEETDSVEIRLPKGKAITIPVESCSFARDSATCSVIKDGGDDPDVTHGAEIVAELSLTDRAGEIEIDGGRGVGIVTKPGLGLEIGKPAINPVPKRMIRENLRDAGGKILAERGIRVVISVPQGESLGPRTDNPRIGIRGGISILGTSGIVIPFSTASYAASIRQNLDVAIAMGDDTVVLTTGGRSEDFARRIIGLPDHCFVQMGDFSGYTMQQCGRKGIKKAHVVGFIGKLAKMAAGVKQTHVKGSKVDMDFLAGLAAEAGAGEEVAGEIRRANTARHVAEIVQRGGPEGFFDLVCGRVREHMRGHAGREISLDVILFDFEGNVLARREG